MKISSLLRPIFALTTLISAFNAAPTQAAPAIGPNFTPSRFPGVSVRHVPGPVVKNVKRRPPGRGERGIVLRNVRPAPDPRNGVMADIDQSSNLAMTATVAATKANSQRKKAATRPAPKAAPKH